MTTRTTTRTTTPDRPTVCRLAVAGALVVALAACGDDPAEPAADGEGEGERPAVTASFYPLEYVVATVGGEHIAVTNLTPPGGEPHDLELSPRQIADLQDADLVVYLSGFVPALDAAIDAVSAGGRFDVAESAGLEADEHAEDEHAEDEHAEDEHAEDEHAEDEHEHGGNDPHFWLDPTLYADVSDAVAGRLAELAPEHAAEFAANAADLRGRLTELDAEFEAGLADCASRDLVTSHTAFAYLAERYGLHQVGISGLAPDEAPSPAKLAEVAEFVREHEVTTIFYETLVDPQSAETIASETGASTAVLDPIEGLTDESAGADYFEVMRSNLASLQAGLGCS